MKEDCKELNKTIENFWNRADNEIDVDQFLFTTGLVSSFLQNVSQIDSNSYSPFFKNRAHSLFDILKEYEEVVKTYQHKILFLLNSVHTRSKVNKLNSRQLYELNVLWNSHDFERDEQLINANRSRLLSSIGVEEGIKMWDKYFKDLDLNQIPWDRFTSAYKAFTKTNVTTDEEILLKHILDNDRMSTVTPKEFSRFLKCFGPLKEALNEAKKMYSQVWFHNFMSSEEASRLLAEQAVGTFLIRFSKSRYDVLVLEYIESKNQIRSVPIFIDMPNGVTLKDESQKEIRFTDIQSLINHHKCTLKYPFQFDLLRRNWYSGSVTTKESEEMLLNNPTGTFMIRLSEEGKFQYIVSYVSKMGIKHLLMQKIATGFIVQNVKDHLEDMEWSNTAAIKDLNFPVADSPKTIIFPSLIIFIRLNPHLKYNYDNEHVPTLKISKLKESQKAFELNGIHEESGAGINISQNNISARSIATYPKNSLGYDIICDQLYVKSIGNRVVFSLADGCNWGRGPRRAAQCACTAIINEVADLEVQSDIKDTLDIKHLLLRSFSVAHEMIVKSTQETGVFGTTTLVAGVAFEIDRDNWGAVIATVGDCKVFAMGEDGTVDITFGNRRNISDARDPGGRLGPYIDDNPDLRNLESKFWPLKRGDFLLIVSDGIHDNLDPESSGLQPSDLVGDKLITLDDPDILKCMKDKRWCDLEKRAGEKIKSNWMVNKINEITRGKNTVQEATDALIEYAYNLTKKSREYLENNPSKSEPEDQKEFPGKMDHTTCIIIKAGSQFEQKDLFVVPYTNNGFTRATIRRDKKIERTRSDDDITPTYSKSVPDNYSLQTNINNHNLFMPPLIMKNTRKDVMRIKKINTKGLFESLFSRRFTSLGKYKLKSDFISSTDNVVFGDPNISEKFVIGDVGCGQSVSTLPRISVNESSLLFGDPCASSFALHYSSRITFALSSSSLWGHSHSSASHVASNAFVKYLTSMHHLIKDVKNLIESIGAAYDHAHESIVNTLEKDSSGSTGLFAGCVCQLSNNNFWMVFVNLGICKAYLLSSGQIKDLSESIHVNDSRFSGGKIGVCDMDGEPDVSNLEVQFMNVKEGDIVIIMSPAVHRNFDPEVLGKLPKDCGLTYENWSDIESTELMEVKTKSRCKEMQSLLSSQLEKPHPLDICDIVVNHCKTVTANVRDYMENNPDGVEPNNFVEYPGKMGHTTLLTFEVKGSVDN